MKRTLLLILFGTLLCLSCQDNDDVGDNYATFRGLTIAEYLDEHADSLSEFTDACRAAGAYSLLRAAGKYTIFVPTNEAMRQYYSALGVSGCGDLSQKELRQLVYYHLLDGEANGSRAYTTQDFDGTALADQNMVGRYITTMMDNETPYWILNKTARDIHPDIESETDDEGKRRDIVNGVIHIVDHVMEGNMDLLPDFIENTGGFTLFFQALKATGLTDSLTAMEDENYVQSTTGPDGSDFTTQTQKAYPEKRLYGFTAMAEPDTVYQRHGITTLDELRRYAHEVYDEQYPQDAAVSDETDPRNALNRFVAYHLLDKKVPLSKMVHTYAWVSEFSWFDEQRKNSICYDGKYTIEEYHVSMAPAALIYMQKRGADGSIAINTHRNVFTDADLFNDPTTLQFITAQSDLECNNGMLHALNNIMTFNGYVRNTVLHRRLRLEMQTFLPELTTNNVNSYVNRYNQWHRYIPTGYCKNLGFEEQRPSVYMVYYAANVHPYLWGDELVGYGFFDITFHVKAIPAGKYEVRFGYHVSPDQGVTQIYFDGQPCGIPINMAQNATDGAIGWKCDLEVNGLTKYSMPSWSAVDDPLGIENDKTLRNHGFMKAPDSYVGTVYHNNTEDNILSARNSNIDLRRILGTYTFAEDGDHEIEFVQMKSGSCEFDFIEFMPVDLLETEDRH